MITAECLSVSEFFLIGEYFGKVKHERDCLIRFLRLSAVCWPSACILLQLLQLQYVGMWQSPTDFYVSRGCKQLKLAAYQLLLLSSP